MSERDPGLEAFSKFIVALEPWLGEVVLVGGWAHRLYRLDPRARKLDYLPLTTLDGDVAVPPKLKKEESTVRKRLLEAGFEEEFVGFRLLVSRFSRKAHSKIDIHVEDIQ